ncbi:hypothetical protein JOC34_003959 [Virgibacillus halotolerans]|uniref:hypothetical protein n=1 Tax=Virgibacillus halotolerans TaxID=1071053 RepID=UPI001EF99544|nr:hypothetical protein [Virgibacillus halotolerans]MBM7601534.1 hypothetical protein [Virgibacillus halotolerans]
MTVIYPCTIKKVNEGKIANYSFLEKEGYLRISWMVAEGSRLLREKQQLKIPQEAFFAFEEAEVLSAESDYLERTSYLIHKNQVVFLAFLIDVRSTNGSKSK